VHGAGLGLLAHGWKPNQNTSGHDQDVDLKCEAENRLHASIDTPSLRAAGGESAAETCDIAKKMAYASARGVRKSAPVPGRAAAIANRRIGARMPRNSTRALSPPMFDDSRSRQRGEVVSLYALLIAANACAWIWALVEFAGQPALLGTALLAYTFGLRHAVDADHIAAIDNVVRKLMQVGQRPVSVGFFFALGHSTVVVLATVAIAATAAALRGRFEEFKEVGGVIGTSVSALFLLSIAVVNLVVLIGVWRSFNHVRQGGRIEPEHLDVFVAGGGVLARLFRTLFGIVSRSWHMYPLGFLFGLGFDTATEIGLLGISAAQVAQGMSIWSILIFPALFTSGMALVDTTDGVFMVRAYGWAFTNPIRKLWYNLTITAVSVVVAFLVGGIEALGLLADKLNLEGSFWDTIRSLNESFGTVGFVVIGAFVLCWIVSAFIYRWNHYEELASEISVTSR
jgi:nickel/cobalt transporter (NiCoT) family protein